jgi:hypothetical protein
MDGFTAWAAAGLPLITPGHSQPQPTGDHYPEGRNATVIATVSPPAGPVRRHITGQIAALGAAHAPTEET